jgi:site-specific DNA-methyltransferase (adenine-specific)
LTTTAKERVKKEDGHLIKWQKPIKLFDRIIAPFCNGKVDILDPFMGSGTTALVAKESGRNYLGIELNPKYIKI